ncbi:unnamed protein product [Angiostrongylus costaricensis]|uniref:Uncharacterized protein n=1 Tax=Angiostrongylus costaricensis TaxID=334426 RepID=A0A0R3PNE8_ANGCS|nr:unnamed protein product [Angiostrongylus costaricensis]
MSLIRDEFQWICQTISGHESSLNKAELYTAVCCAGKSVIRSHLDNLWPSDKEDSLDSAKKGRGVVSSRGEQVDEQSAIDTQDVGFRCHENNELS